jgi:hypothetical protein
MARNGGNQIQIPGPGTCAGPDGYMISRIREQPVAA